ncbi:MAG: thiamine phosphate synthase [Chloroflexota bacterium]|nr:thiamine phosphate synthase [Chloroflexota bacterium]
MLDPDQLAVYLIADPEQTSAAFLPTVEAALDGGVTMVQLRVKRGGDLRAYNLALEVQKRCQLYEVPFLVNDRLDVALAVNADGVHVGVNDLPTSSIRGFTTPGFTIGFSPESDEQSALARTAGADYLGIGPVFGTGSKSDAGSPIGLDLLRRRSGMSDLPVVAIGGITLDNVRDVMTTSVVGIAVISAILRATDPRDAARRFVDIVGLAKERRNGR